MRKLLFALLFLLLSSPLLSENMKIMRLEEVKPGMKGYASTVFSGNIVENFDIEVVDIIKNLFPQSDAILIRLVGPRVEKTGVVSGMSGSPVYINEKLIGALAYSFGSFQKDPIAGVTPIERMIKISEKEKNRALEVSSTSSQNKRLMQLALTGNYKNPFDLLRDAGEMHFNDAANSNALQPIMIPLAFSGFDLRMISKHETDLARMGFVFTQGGSGATGSVVDKHTLEPGDAVSGVIVSGDLSISGTGTVTFTEGNKIYAFGHPFFNSGPVNMPMAKARILTTLSSLQHSRKFSSTGQIIGAIRQDRPSGIMGVIGEDAPVYPVRVEYTSPFETAKVFNYKIAKDKSLSDFSSIFLWFTLLTTLETARFSTGDYNLNMDAKIILNGDEDIIIRNVYTSAQFGEAEGGGTDIMAAATDVVMVLMPLVSNIFQYPDIEKLDLKFNATPGRQNLAIEKIWYDKTEILPGDDLKLRIQVRGYQEEASIIHHNISIPEYISGSRLAVAVGSADYMRRLEQNINPAKFRPQNYNELIDLLNNRKKNNQIYIQLLAMEKGAFVSGKELSDLPPSMLNIFKSPKVKGENTKMNQAVLSERRIPMDYRVFGGETISIRISKYRTF